MASMAPHTRAAAEDEITDRASWNYSDNSRVLVALPLEILHRIVSAAQGAIIPWMNEIAMDKKYCERRDSIFTLCQVCRSLRVALLPLLWERLEACSLPGEENRPPGRRLLSKSLLFNQLNVVGVIQPLYASFVKIVNIAIEPLVAHDMLCSLAPALALMPNLHTIQIILQPDMPQGRTCIIRVTGSWTFHDAFKDQCYPSIKRAILPEQAMTILDCFPEVREVCLNTRYQGTFHHFVQNLARHCSKLERFGWIECLEEEALEEELEEYSRVAIIAKELPKIRELEYHMRVFNVNEIPRLARLENLEHLSLVIDAHDDQSQCDDAVLRAIEAAKKVLFASSGVNKSLDMIFRTETLSFTKGLGED